jgi:hypothetical protein
MVVNIQMLGEYSIWIEQKKGVKLKVFIKYKQQIVENSEISYYNFLKHIVII